MLGKNRREVAIFKEHRTLLEDMSRFRAVAETQVAATIIQLGTLKATLSDLRGRVAAPRRTPIISFEAHLDSLRRGVERLESAKQNRLNECACPYRRRNDQSY